MKTKALEDCFLVLDILENTGDKRLGKVNISGEAVNVTVSISQHGNHGNNVICYTSLDEAIINPDDTYDFGANIISNTYENGLGKIVFDGPVTSIGENAFCRRSSLTSVVIPNSVTSIGENAFYNCKNLESFTGKFASEDNRCLIIDGELKSFAPAELTSYAIPNSVTSIGEGAFGECTSLTSVEIPNSITSIGYFAFGGCTRLKSVKIPNSVTSIGKNVFCLCSSLTSITGKFASEDHRCLIVNGVLNSFAPAGMTSYTIPNYVTSIGDRAFYYCSGLTSVEIPNSVTSIGFWAFYECSGLTSVYCKPTTPPTLGLDPYSRTSPSLKIYVPNTSVSAYMSAPDWSIYSSKIVGYNF